jgi:hypothetical protein
MAKVNRGTGLGFLVFIGVIAANLSIGFPLPNFYVMVMLGAIMIEILTLGQDIRERLRINLLPERYSRLPVSLQDNEPDRTLFQQ